ncbi:DUF4394 domain-containing protein [Streptomyces sp. NPDC001922]|uniref:DUF4394 domain-containing protein n=1 Tax=Streptomyces sp. NPDC001922 TaxID=3364624 RepID=UPI00368297E3
MRNRVIVSALVVAAGAALLSPVGTAGADDGAAAVDPSRGVPVVGLVGGRALAAFDSDRPEHARPLGRIEGLRDDQYLVGIDYRVQDGRLYGVGNRGGVYTLTTPHLRGGGGGEPQVRARKVSQLTVRLQGRYFGVDFNPVTNQLRIISDTGQNLRHRFEVRDHGNGRAVDGDEHGKGRTFVDERLTNVSTPSTNSSPDNSTHSSPSNAMNSSPDNAMNSSPNSSMNPSMTSGDRNGGRGRVATGVTGAAYSNNDRNPGSGTTLFDIDTDLDRLSIQAPPNAGTLNPVGRLGVKVGPNAGFDIHTDAQRGTNTGYASLGTREEPRAGGGNHERRGFYQVNLLNGRARLIGFFPERQPVEDVAVPTDNHS